MDNSKVDADTKRADGLRPVECWTDYPIAELGDKSGQKAPIRRCTALDWDSDKYANVLVEGVRTNFKVGYLYPREQRAGEGPCIDPHLLPVTDA